jgi:putative ABC transport system permease protein
MLFANSCKKQPMFAINFKIAIRNIRKHLAFSLINIVGLAIGLASCLMLLLYVNYEWSYDKQFKNIDRIYFAELNLKLSGNIVTLQATPYQLAPTAPQEIPGIEVASRISDEENKLFTYQDNKIKLLYNYVDPSFLEIFDYSFIAGNAASALKEPNSIILTATSARKLFGNQDPIGKTLIWDNQKPLKVTAVIADLPKNQSLQFEALQTWAFYDQLFPQEKNNGWGSISCPTIFKLKENADFNTADASLRKLVKRHHKETQMEIFLFPLKKFHLYDEFKNGKNVGGQIDQVKLFFFLAFCVLLIASINYMNLSTARSEKRAREVGVRKALGSSRKSLMGQFLLESVLLSFLAMVIAFALIELTLPYFNQLLEINITINNQSPLFWAALLALVLITGLLSGCYPALYLSSFTPVKVLKGFTNIGKSSLPIRKLLVVFQFSLSIVMIIGATIVYSQIQFMKNKPLGFTKDNLVELNLEGEFTKPIKVDLFKKALKEKNVVDFATEYAAGFTDNGGTITGDFNWPGKSPKDDYIINYRSVGYDFVKTVDAKMSSGRDFSKAFASDTASGIVINQAAATMMAQKNPVGTPVSWGDKKLFVIGVMQDYNNATITNKAQPIVFYFNPQKSKSLLLRLNPNQHLSTAIQTIKDTSQRLNPAYPPSIKYISEGMEEKIRAERLLGVLSNLFGSFAIVISCLGLLGLALFMAEQRKREISIRRVLGANLQSILMLLNKDFIKLVLISNIIAIPIAYILLANWLKPYEYKVDMELWPFLMAITISLTIAVLTVSIQSFKVAKANPVNALKYE